MSNSKEGSRQQSADELQEKVLFINRCAKVVKGGRKFSFSALILVGDGRGTVGYGFAKANELTDAIRKGGEAARKNLRRVPMMGNTIPHEINVKWDGAQLYLAPAPEGAGVVAGSLVRSVLEMAGIKDVMAKNLGSNNPINMLKATFKALEEISTRDELKKLRGKK